MIPHKQLSLEDIFQDCQEKFYADKPAFLSLLENHIDLDELIPVTFYNHFYASTGRSRKYHLHALLWALIIQRIFSIPTDQLLLTFLHYSRPLREFCGFSKVPDASKITRFKQDFLEDLQTVFDNLVDLTEPICQAIDSAKADMTIFDSSLLLKKEGNNTAFLNNGIVRQKFICPMTTWDKCADGKYRRICHCENPCTSSVSGRMVYIYPEKNLRAYPGTLRGTEEWDNTYQTRTVVEREINHIKDNLCLAGRRTQNEKTLYADLILAGITQLITVVLADKIKHHEYLRSLKPLIS